jgi:hydroxymethylbilane synthase
MRRSVIIGTRGSDLALWQANFVKARLEANFPDTTFEIKIIVTTGDAVVDTALSKIGDKGLFTRQIESALLDGEIDLAVHSLKDLQTTQPEGLTIGAVCEREVPNDALISRTGIALAELPNGASVATGSLRRRSQLLNLRPDLQIREIRGNVPTRLRKFDESDIDAMVLAFAGLERLGLGDRISETISTDVLLPAVGQGAVAVEIRDNDNEVGEIVSTLDHFATRVCVRAERAFLKELEGGCQVPIGGLASTDGTDISLAGFVGSLDGKVCCRETFVGSVSAPEELGRRLAEELADRGARELVEDARSGAKAADALV